MAGKHRVKTKTVSTDRIDLRIPSALKAHLEDEALAHGNSLNQEIIERLMPKTYSAEVWKQLHNLQYDKTSTPRELALKIAQIKGEPIPVFAPDDEFEDVEIDWLPGSEGELWNQTKDTESPNT